MVSSVEVEESSVLGVGPSVEMEESLVEVWKVWVDVDGGGWWMELFFFLRTTPGIPTWSPTVVLTWLDSA